VRINIEDGSPKASKVIIPANNKFEFVVKHVFPGYMVMSPIKVNEYVALQSHGNTVLIMSATGCISYGVVIVPVIFIGGPISIKALYAAFPCIIVSEKNDDVIVFPITVLLRLKALMQDLHVIAVVVQ